MSGAPETDYDAVLYPSALYPQTHPDRLATNATVFGLTPPPIERARVLELGCGDGTNLIAMAEALPGSRFLGVDLASAPIRQGIRVIEALGFQNVEIRQLDLLQFPPDLGEFDYIIAHGLYSWVPQAVREKILSICARHLGENGVAYVSYNAYPGSHLRDLVRFAMRFHAAHIADPREKIKQARALVKFAAEAREQPGLWQNILAQELDRISRYTDAGFFHDDLSAIYQPFYFSEFMDAAQRHGLQFLSEADVTDMRAAGFTESASEVLRQLDTTDIVAREQYVDFLKGRAFRQTLLCRQGLTVARDVVPGSVRSLFVAGDVRPAAPPSDRSSVVSEDFHGPKGSVIATSHPVARAALRHLGQIFPAVASFADLLALARTPVGRGDDEPVTSGTQDEVDLAEFIARSYTGGFLELHARRSSFTVSVSEKPMASRLARLQLESSDTIGTLRHSTYRVEGDLARALLQALDGTRDRRALLEALRAALRDRAERTEPALPGDVDLGAELDDQLKHLARAGLLQA